MVKKLSMGGSIRGTFKQPKGGGIRPSKEYTLMGGKKPRKSKHSHNALSVS